MSNPALSTDRPHVVSRWHTPRCVTIAAVVGAACTYGATLYMKPPQVSFTVVTDARHSDTLSIVGSVKAILESSMNEVDKNRRLDCLLQSQALTKAGHKPEGKCV